MKKIIFVLGGCRSGKSRFALSYANSHYKNKVFLATSQALDKEMERRIEIHKKNRGKDWLTLEEPVEIGSSLKSLKNGVDVVLIDCITLWVNNLFLAGEGEEEILSRTVELREVMKNISPSLIVVSNEVGTGIVPDNKIARLFRDIAGIVNQKLAQYSDIVVMTVAGIPQVIKGGLSSSAGSS